MAFFNKVGESLSSASKSVAEKAKQLAEVSSLNGRINTQEEIVERAYLEMGKRYYELHNENPDESFSEFCTSIKEALIQIDTLNEEIRKVKGIQVCGVCGAEVLIDATFCQKCGNKVTIPVAEVVSTSVEVTPEVTQDVKVCTNCGKAQDIDTSFCCECGSRFDDK